MDMGSGATLSYNASLSTMTNGNFNDSGDFGVTQQAQNSQIRVNGWPPASSNAWVESDSNAISGVAPGLTFNLKSAGESPPATVDITVSTDTESIKENIRTFVEQVNEVRSLIKELTNFDSLKQSGSIMTGNYGVQIIDSNLRLATSSISKGFHYYDEASGLGDVYTSISQLGILTDAQEGSATQGLLILDEDALDEALEADPDAVAEVFAASFKGGQIAESGNYSYTSHIDGITKAGSYDVAYDLDGAGNIMNAYINGVAAAVDQEANTLTATSGDASGLVVRVNDLTPNTSGRGTVNLKQGKAGELAATLSELTNVTSGPLHIIEKNYDTIIDNIDEKIFNEESRLTRMERDLTNKYARLEATLGQYSQLSTSLTSQINGLTSSSS